MIVDGCANSYYAISSSISSASDYYAISSSISSASDYYAISSNISSSAYAHHGRCSHPRFWTVLASSGDDPSHSKSQITDSSSRISSTFSACPTFSKPKDNITNEHTYGYATYKITTSASSSGTNTHTCSSEFASAISYSRADSHEGRSQSGRRAGTSPSRGDWDGCNSHDSRRIRMLI